MKQRQIINVLISLIAIIAIGFGVYFYYKLNKLQSNPNEKKAEISTALIDKVSKIYLLPFGETPTIATVSDPSATFFTISEKGDKVLFFQKSGKAVLYRPSLDKIVDIVSIQSKQNVSSNQNNTNVEIPKENPN